MLLGAVVAWRSGEKGENRQAVKVANLWMSVTVYGADYNQRMSDAML